MTSDKGWSDYWLKEGAGGEVFVSEAHDKHPGLADFWRSIFEPETGSLRILDIASGAGSIFAHLPGDHCHELSACDLSSEALRLLGERLGNVDTTQCVAEDLPYPDQHFDLVVSQFGVEYAGEVAFEEAARVLAPGGKLRLLTHRQGSYIDARTRQQLAAALAARDSYFTIKASTLVRAVYMGNEPAIKNAASAFKTSEVKMTAALEQLPEGIHAHLYQGFRQLYGNREKYAVTDILQWLADMSDEIDTAITRLSHMQEAALDKEAVVAITDTLQAAGLVVERPLSLHLPDHDLPLAWHLAATRPTATGNAS